jgi:hypothetical protein
VNGLKKIELGAKEVYSLQLMTISHITLSI